MTLLPMENKERIFCALKCYNQGKPEKIPPILENYIKQVSRNGQTMFPWLYIKPLLLDKFNHVVDNFHSNGMILLDHIPFNSTLVEELRQRVYNAFSRLDGIPFTIQRICELLEVPNKHYLRVDKFLRGMEKVCMIVSTVDPQGNKIHQEDPRFPSQAGLDECSLMINGSLSPSSPGNSNQTKSSDDENIDEDDGEDNNSDEVEESHSSSLCTSDLSSSSPVINTPTVSSWLFKPHNAANLPCTPPMKTNTLKHKLGDHTIMSTLCGGLLTDPLDDNEYETTELSKSTNIISEVSDKDVLGSTTDESESIAVSQSSTIPVSVSELLKPTVPLDSCGLSSWKDIKSNKKNVDFFNESNETHLTVDDPGLSLIDSSNNKSIHGLSMDVPASLCSAPHDLRPIGQLEAFVQNLTSEVACSTTTSFSPSTTTTNQIVAGDTASPDSSSVDILPDGSIKLDLFEQSNIVFSTTPTFYGKRHSSSPELGSTSAELDEPFVETDDLTNVGASPAKKCKLDASVSGSNLPDLTSNNQSMGTLNDSPPLILCNPLNVATDETVEDHVFQNDPSSLNEDSDLLSADADTAESVSPDPSA